MATMALRRAVLLLALALPLAACGDGRQEVRVLRSELSAHSSRGMPPPATQFYLKDKVYIYAEATWDDTTRPAGKRRLQYRWFTGDKIIADFGGEHDFSAAPDIFWAYCSGKHFSVGHHRVQLYIDDVPVAQHEFDILPGERPEPLPPPDEASLREQIKSQGRTLVQNGKGELFAQEAEEWRASRELTPGGWSKLALLYGGVADAGFKTPDDPGWKPLMDAQSKWQIDHPESVPAAVVGARLLYLQAWAWRGTDASSQTSRDALGSYSQLLKQAWQLLENHPEGANDPEWQAMRVQLAMQLGAEKEDLLRMAQDAMTRDCCYPMLYMAMVKALLPEWGGSPELFARYIETTLAASRGQAGTQMYGRIWFDFMRRVQDPRGQATAYGIDWKRMAQAHEEILAAYPDPYNHDSAKAVACLAREWAVFQRLGAWQGPVQTVAWWDALDFRRGCEVEADRVAPVSPIRHAPPAWDPRGWWERLRRMLGA